MGQRALCKQLSCSTERGLLELTPMSIDCRTVRVAVLSCGRSARARAARATAECGVAKCVHIPVSLSNKRTKARSPAVMTLILISCSIRPALKRCVNAVRRT